MSHVCMCMTNYIHAYVFSNSSSDKSISDDSDNRWLLYLKENGINIIPMITLLRGKNFPIQLTFLSLLHSLFLCIHAVKRKETNFKALLGLASYCRAMGYI